MRTPKVVAALVVAVTLFLTSLVASLVLASPAHSAAGPGWSGQVCQNNTEGWRMCAQTHTVAWGAGDPGSLWVDTIQLCMTMNSPNNHIAGSFQNSFGGPIWGGLPNTGKSQCVYVYPARSAGHVGGGACVNFSGRIDRVTYPDQNWGTIRVRVTGAQTC